VTEALTIGADRQKSIGDYLRDAANSEATLANLRLQRIVIVLAVLTMLVGVLALIPGVLTDEQKKAFWNARQTPPAPEAPAPPPPPLAPSK
jgi:hypothetical protein